MRMCSSMLSPQAQLQQRPGLSTLCTQQIVPSLWTWASSFISGTRAVILKVGSPDSRTNLTEWGAGEKRVPWIGSSGSGAQRSAWTSPENNSQNSGQVWRATEMTFSKVPSSAHILWIHYPLIWLYDLSDSKKNSLIRSQDHGQWGKNESANFETTHFLHNYVVSPNTYLNSTSSSHDTFKETLMKKNPLRFITAELYIILVSSWKRLNRCNNAFGIK